MVMMIASGSITATISQQDGMVRFDTSPASYSSPDMLALLEGGVTAAITLDRQVQRYGDCISLSYHNISYLILSNLSFKKFL